MLRSTMKLHEGGPGDYAYDVPQEDIKPTKVASHLHLDVASPRSHENKGTSRLFFY